MTTILEHQVNFINEEIIKLKLENQQLKDLNLLHRKGSPKTFDAYGFLELIKNIKKKENLSFPIFDRDADETI